ncbi:MAG: LolA-like outer membrane lipoprotein chaperone [Campylobacterota bacterium]|nr:LolA-like outer membrane lipoprotein chaperone [Campylobacterota bacterium]
MKKIIFLIFLSITFLYGELPEIKTFKADFSQSIINVNNKKIDYKGTIYVKQPGFILWRYIEPIQKDVFINYTSVTIIEPELEQVLVTRLQKQIDILKLLKDAKKVSNNKYIANLYNNKYNLTVENGIFKSIEYQDEIENKITITFENIEQNKDIKNSTFRYTIPEDYDIIRK